MNRDEYAEHLKKEIQIGACWVIVLLGLLGLSILQVSKDPGFQDPLTWVIVGVTAIVFVAGFIDDRIRGKKNRKIRAEHAHLRRKN